MLRNLLTTLVLFLLVACGGKGGPGQAPGSAAEGLLGILVTPEEVVVPQGGSVQLQAIGLYEGRKTADLTVVVDWQSANKAIVSPAQGLDGEGRFDAGAVGSTEVRAVLDGIKSPPVLVTVTSQSVTQLLVEPDELVVEAGQQVPLSAMATFSDGSRSDATGIVRWITDNGSIATIQDGLLTAGGTGNTTIRAQYEEVVSNNVAVEVLAEASPDLRVATLSASPYDGRVTVVVEVENVGQSGASSFWVDGFLDFPGTPGPGDYGEVYERLSWIGPGDTAQVVLEFPDVSQGAHDITVAVDTEDEVDESNEGNNTADTTVHVTNGGGGTGTGTGGTTTWSTWTTPTTTTTTTLPADIEIDRVDVIYDGTYAYYEVEISNYGDSGAGPFYVDVYADSFSAPAVGTDGDDWTEIAWLGAWSSVTVDFLVPYDCYWGCYSWVRADSYDDISEPNESNNLYGPIDVY